MTFEQAEARYGTVKHEGREIVLTCDAVESNRVLPAPYTNLHEVEDGEVYDFEMIATGVDAEGDGYRVTWIFMNEPKGVHDSYDHLDFESNYEVERV